MEKKYSSATWFGRRFTLNGSVITGYRVEKKNPDFMKFQRRKTDLEGVLVLIDSICLYNQD